jgi:hypothetical protein
MMCQFNRFAACTGLLAAILWAVPVPSSAAETGTLPRETPSHQTVPEAVSPGSGGSSGEPLSDKLDRQGGVIRPPGGIDPNMTQSPPAVGKTPVIPPPGTPGGEQGVKPK